MKPLFVSLVIFVFVPSMPRPNAKRKTLNVKRLYLPHVSAQGNNICVNLGYQCSKIKPRISRISRIRLRPHGFHEATFVQFVIFVVHKIVHLEIRVICAIRGSLNVLCFMFYVLCFAFYVTASIVIRVRKISVYSVLSVFLFLLSTTFVSLVIFVFVFCPPSHPCYLCYPWFPFFKAISRPHVSVPGNKIRAISAIRVRKIKFQCFQCFLCSFSVHRYQFPRFRPRKLYSFDSLYSRFLIMCCVLCFMFRALIRVISDIRVRFLKAVANVKRKTFNVKRFSGGGVVPDYQPLMTIKFFRPRNPSC
jgi:hypothetical protein